MNLIFARLPFRGMRFLRASKVDAHGRVLRELPHAQSFRAE
jgi:hypothetical protein